jgi:hypothetical protein
VNAFAPATALLATTRLDHQLEAGPTQRKLAPSGIS